VPTRLIKNETSQHVIPAGAKSRIKCGINFEPRFDRFDKFDKLTASKLTSGRLTVLLVLPVLSRVEGSRVEGSEV